MAVVKTTLLSKLAFVAEDATKSHDRTETVRGRFIDGIKIQLEALEAEKTNKPFTLKRERREKDEATGETKKFEKEVRFNKWWEVSQGVLFVFPRYGSKRIALSSMGPAIKAGTKLDDVKNVLELLIEATNGGELDKALLEATERKAKTQNG